MAKDKEFEYLLSLKDEATAVWKKFSSGVSKETGDLRSMFGGLGTAIGGALSVAAAKSFMDSAAEAAAISEGLIQNLKNQGLYTDEVAESMLNYSEILKNKTAVDDDEITKIQDMMLGMTGNLDAVRELTPAVLDLMRGTGMSADAAAKMFSRSVEGAEGLKKLGITIGDVTDETERYKLILAEIEKRFGGRAAAWAESDAGKMHLAALAMDDVGKAAGKMLNGAIMPLAPALKEATDLFLGLPEPMKSATFVTGGMTAAVLLLNASLLANPLTYVALGFAALTAVVVTGYGEIKKANIEFTDFNTTLGASVMTALGFTEWMERSKRADVSAAESLKKHKEELEKLTFGTEEYIAKFKHIQGLERAIAASRKRDTEEQKKANEAIKTASTSEQLKKLKEDLDKLTVGTKEYAEKASEIARIEKQVSDATELAKRSFGGMKDEIGYLQKDLEKLEPGTRAYINMLYALKVKQNEYKDAVDRSELAVSQMMHRLENPKAMDSLGTMISRAKDDLSKVDLSGNNEEMIKRIKDQADVMNDVRYASFNTEKERELATVDDWEKKAIEMAHGAQGVITDIQRVAADERASIERQAAQKMFEDVAGYAKQGLSIISKFTQQSYQSEIQALEKKKDKAVKSIEDEREAVRDKYADLLENEYLTAKEKDALKKSAAAEDENILKRKAAIEDDYNKKIASEKRRAFEAEKEASIIEAVINTAVAVAGALPNIPLSIIVAGLGAAQVALIASQPVPTFHGGGSGYFDAPSSSEAKIKIRGGETFDVYTPEQRDAQKQSRGNISLTLNFNSPFTPEQAVRSAINELSRQTGLPVDQLFTNQNSSIVVL